MPKKKTTTVVEEETLETPKEYTHEEIHGKSMEQIAKEPDEKKESEVVAEEKKPEQETKQEEVKEPVVPPIDPEQLKKETTEAATQAVKEELADFLKKKDEKEDNRDNYQKWADQFSEDTGKAPSWIDVAKFLKDEAKAEIRAEQEEATKQVEEDTQKKEKAKQEYLEDFNKEVDEELNELYTANKLTRIKDPNDDRVDKEGIPLEPGKREKAFLFNAMAATNAQRVKDGQQPITSISRIYANYYKSPTRQPAGADAAIINNRSGSASADTEEINYLRDVKGGFKSLYNAVTKR